MFFYNSLYEHRKLITVDNVGIVGTTLNVFLDCETKADGVLIMDSTQMILVNTVKPAKNVEVLQAFTRTITKHNLNIDNNYLEIDKDNLVVFVYFYASFSFITVSKKMQVIDKKLMKLYLQFIRNSFFNFVGNNCNNNNGIERSWKYLCKLYEVFFLEYLSKKFYSVLMDILSYEDNLIKDQEKLKNVYLVELPQNYIQQRKHSIIVTSSLEPHKTNLLLDLRKLWRKRRRKKLYITSNDIWQYILHAIQNHNEAHSIKIEFFSTFPRLNVVGKFLKVGNGYAMIELYEVNKLSRHASKYSEYEMTIHKHSNYNEHMVSNNSSNKNYFTITRSIEMFVKEYFGCVHNGCCVYTAMSSCLLYFDIDMLSSIDDALYMRLSFENLVSFLYRKLKSILTVKTATTTVIANNKHSNAYNNNTNSKHGMISCLEIQKGFIYNVLFENASPCLSMNNSRCGFEKGLSFIEKSVVGFSRQLSKIAVDVGNLDNTLLCNISELGLNEIPDISEYNDYSFNAKEIGNSFGNGSNLNVQSKPVKKQLLLQKRNTLFNIGRDKDYTQSYMVDKKDKHSILKDIQNKLCNYEVNGMVSNSNTNNNGKQGGNSNSNNNSIFKTDLRFTKMKTCQMLNNAGINNVQQLDEEEEDYCSIIKK